MRIVLVFILILHISFSPAIPKGARCYPSYGSKAASILLSDSTELLQIRIAANPIHPAINEIGWDTEKTGKEKINLLKDPITLKFLHNGNPVTAQATVEQQTSAVRYRYAFSDQQWLSWEISVGKGKMQMAFAASDQINLVLDKIDLVFPFDPAIAVTSVISSTWKDKKFIMPAILSAPDIGQLLISSKELPAFAGRMEGSRGKKWLTTILEIDPGQIKKSCTINFSPVRLPMPKGFKNKERWQAARRGWFNMLQFSSGASGGNSNVMGVWANNALSDPVSSLVYMLGDATVLIPELAPGVEMPEILRHTLEYWMYHKTNDEGLVTYTAKGEPGREQQPPDSVLEKLNPSRNQNVMDGNPAIIIGAWSYMASSKTIQWLSNNIERLEFIAQYMVHRDEDDDGITESKQSGNSGSRSRYRNPDCAFDCYSSGYKNAYVNILAFRAWKAMEDMEKKLGRLEKAAFYNSRAERLQKVFVSTFFNPGSGWLGWWRSRDGELHDIHSDFVTSMAIVYGLLDVEKGREMLKRYWSALQQTGFNRFDLGVPLNIKPVAKKDMEHYTEFQQFLNGGATVFNTATLIDALYMVGMKAEADMVLNSMLNRQQRGAFANGGGFQNGFVDRMGYGAEVFDWNGKPAGYEGHLVYSWGFLHSVLFKDPAFRKRRIFY